MIYLGWWYPTYVPAGSPPAATLYILTSSVLTFQPIMHTLIYLGWCNPTYVPAGSPTAAALCAAAWGQADDPHSASWRRRWTPAPVATGMNSFEFVNSHLSHRIIDSFPRMFKWKITNLVLILWFWFFLEIVCNTMLYMIVHYSLKSVLILRI